VADQHPITPPPELVQQWREQAPRYRDGGVGREDWLMARAAQWGADEELEACCEWLRSKDILEPAIDALRAARRPAPPSLKEQALALIDLIQDNEKGWDIRDLDVVRRALEAQQ
jgi:hypothetical protein